MRKIISNLCDISEKSYYVWKNKSHKKLINLLEKYFTKKDLEEFLLTQEISKFEPPKSLENNEEELKKTISNLNKYIELLESK